MFCLHTLLEPKKQWYIMHSLNHKDTVAKYLLLPLITLGEKMGPEIKNNAFKSTET